ncbi:MAG: hypothetical protein AAF203_10160, partial [Pseudomonadota bacterium]
TMKLLYDNGSNKPTQIEQVNFGKISITYDSQGEVEAVVNTGKRNVSSSLVENFLQFLEFLGPLGESLKI